MGGSMAGPRKVRVFRDRRKSPNWYVEWRDVERRRHCESGGPRRKDAEERARQIAAELQEMRTAGALAQPTPPGPSPLAPPQDTPVIRARLVVRCAEADVPV